MNPETGGWWTDKRPRSEAQWINDCEKRAAEGQARYEEAEARALRWQKRTEESQRQVKALVELLEVLDASLGAERSNIRKTLRDMGYAGWTLRP